MSTNNQIVGNMGLFYVCYQLSRRGWNVIPTSRNARGIDIIAYNQEGTRFVDIQVKTLSKRNPVPLVKSLDDLMGKFRVIVNRVATDEPNVYILKLDEVKEMAYKPKTPGKTHWLQPNQYEQNKFLDKWERLGKPF